MPFIVRNINTKQYIGKKLSGYPKRHNEVKFKKDAKRYKSISGIKRSIRYVVKNPNYWYAVEAHQAPEPGVTQNLVIMPNNYEIIEVKK